jgi:hypothetical protein
MHPGPFLRNLQHKSRDEIEYDFMAAERILGADELAHYTYQIFDLQRTSTNIMRAATPKVSIRTEWTAFSSRPCVNSAGMKRFGWAATMSPAAATSGALRDHVF